MSSQPPPIPPGEGSGKDTDGAASGSGSTTAPQGVLDISHADLCVPNCLFKYCAYVVSVECSVSRSRAAQVPCCNRARSTAPATAQVVHGALRVLAPLLCTLQGDLLRACLEAVATSCKLSGCLSFVVAHSTQGRLCSHFLGI